MPANSKSAKKKASAARTAGGKASAGKAAGKKPDQGKTPPKKSGIPWGVLFWVAFFLVVFCLFFMNRDNIRRTLRESQQISISETVPSETVPGTVSEPAAEVVPGTVSSPAVPGTVSVPDNTVEPVVPGTVLEPEAPPAARVAQDRTMYFINIDSDGSVLRTRVNRSLPVTDSPLTDTISALLAGPAPDEQRKGLISLIPEGTRILSATVRGNTAYINLNEDFQFNVYGVEGYAGALRQLVWTATEFSNVKDVQILIEGRRIDYLGEGVWIGSPVNRDMF